MKRYGNLSVVSGNPLRSIPETTESQSFQLQNKLKSYQPGPYKTFEIKEPKPRLISAAPYRDRIVHHALCNIIVPSVHLS